MRTDIKKIVKSSQVRTGDLKHSLDTLIPFVNKHKLNSNELLCTKCCCMKIDKEEEKNSTGYKFHMYLCTQSSLIVNVTSRLTLKLHKYRSFGLCN